MGRALPVADDSAAVIQAEHQLAQAHVELDVNTIDSLLHPEYVIIQPGGAIETKAEVLGSYRTGTRHWDMAQVDQLDVHVYGDTAVVIGRWQASGLHGAKRFEYAARFLSIWVKQKECWQNRAYQSTEIERD